VICGGSGRVDLESDLGQLARGKRAHHGFRGRRATDISQTNEEDPHGSYLTL